MTPTSIALNRFGLGYRQGDGLPRDPKAWLRGQIASFDPRPGSLAKQDYSPEGALARIRQIEAMREARIQSRQKDDREAAARAKEEAKEGYKNVRLQYAQDVALRLRNAATSETPFMERMVLFWSNHFTVSTARPRLINLAGAYEFTAIRPHVTGKFADLLKAAALHPGMLFYLDQTKSIGDDSMAATSGRLKGQRGLNENLGREILELHTLGVNGGYTQADVIELAKGLTGWVAAGSTVLRQARPMGNGSAFHDPFHQPGRRQMLGRSYAQDGPDQALAMLSDLAVHPATARFIATKLTRHFAGDNPPAAMVARLEKRFLDTGGDLPALYQAIIDSPEAWVANPIKVRQPFEWLTGIIRASGEQLVGDFKLQAFLEQMAQPVWGAPSPAGWDDRAESWLAPNALLRRVEVADAVSQRTRLSDVRALAQSMFPGTLSRQTEEVIRGAESNQMALALVALSPEMLRR